jgi:OOP family OmpA-OmpF porin
VKIDRQASETLIGADSTLVYGGSIVFDFNSAQLRSDAHSLLTRLKDRIPAHTKLAVTGYADETGDPEYNKRLSLARARAVAGELDGFPTVVAGVGGDTTLYPNDTPEGRFYSRSVLVMVLP